MIAPTGRSELVNDLLSRAADDWVSIAEVYDVALGSGMDDPVNLRDLALGLIARVISDDLVVAGDVTAAGHVPWPLSPAESILRITREWGQLENPSVMPGEIAWLNATPAGEAIGRTFWLPARDGA